MRMDLASTVACVWEAQTPILPTSATAHRVSKAPTVRRGWTGAACSHAGMAGSAWIWATPCAAAAVPASRGRAASTTWTTAPAAPAPTAARAWRAAARAAAPARWASAAATVASAPTHALRAPAPTAAAATLTSPASSAPARPATWARGANSRFTPTTRTAAQAHCPRPPRAQGVGTRSSSFCRRLWDCWWPLVWRALRSCWFTCDAVALAETLGLACWRGPRSHLSNCSLMH